MVGGVPGDWLRSLRAISEVSPGTSENFGISDEWTIFWDRTGLSVAFLRSAGLFDQS